MSFVTSCIEPCKTTSLTEIHYISFTFILTLTNTGRMNHFRTTEVQCASQDSEWEARKCMTFSSFYYIIFLLQPDARASCITIYLLSNITLFPSFERTGSITSHVLQGHDKFSRMPETQISACVWSACVFTRELKSYWLWFSQDKLHQILTTCCREPTPQNLYLWRLQGSKKQFFQRKCKSSALLISLSYLYLKIAMNCILMFSYKQIVQRYEIRI